MENSTKKFRIMVKRMNIKPHDGPARDFNVEEARTSTSSKKSSRRSSLTEEHKKTIIDFEKEFRVLLMNLKASHTLWQEVSGKLNAIELGKVNREPSQWRASILNWRKRVMGKTGEKENMRPIDTAAKKHWEEPC
ncbi:uncharacterized protein LOC110177052 isoform X1 [Drosophila serrata]|uniref:uncharacterized protein LOC110177052 isoform X1 n=1 Tax=Drosophila serrata TaxID=7274 RepID=UPI000A1D2B16|nr:uncharacterized protein LOC110177052 isoform X1 [Drosophila serrata]